MLQVPSAADVRCIVFLLGPNKGPEVSHASGIGSEVSLVDPDMWIDQTWQAMCLL